MGDRERSAQARGRRAEELFESATRIGMDLRAVLAGDGSTSTKERLLRTIESEFVPRLREYAQALSRKDEPSAAMGSLQNLIGLAEQLSVRARTNTLERSDPRTFMESWWPFQREAALWSDIKLLRDPSTGKIRAELATDEDRQTDDFREASMIFFKHAGINAGKGPSLRELHALLQDNEATKHIAWQELNDAPHYGPLRRLIQRNRQQ